MTVASDLCRCGGAPLKIPPILGVQRIFLKYYRKRTPLALGYTRPYMTPRCYLATQAACYLAWSLPPFHLVVQSSSPSCNGAYACEPLSLFVLRLLRLPRLAAAVPVAFSAPTLSIAGPDLRLARTCAK